IIIEDYDIAYTDNRKVQIHFVLEDGRRRILGRCNSISAEYNIFSGRYRYKKHDTFSKGKRRDYRELDIKVNKLSQRQFFAMDWSYMYIHKTIPLVVTNSTDRSRAFEIRSLEFDGKTPDDEDLIGINSLEDVISLEPWASFEINMILPFDDYIPDGTMLIFDFIDIATNSRYLNVYTYDSEIQKCKIDYSFVFLHEDFECE
ncbi:MAG: hypothetical protein J6N76_04280, partial [Lachnospiraceae bacterium]|nr:hypothetical protein [Lachnospiraceae bacterium]